MEIEARLGVRAVILNSFGMSNAQLPANRVHNVATVRFRLTLERSSMRLPPFDAGFGPTELLHQPRSRPLQLSCRGPVSLRWPTIGGLRVVFDYVTLDAGAWTTSAGDTLALRHHSTARDHSRTHSIGMKAPSGTRFAALPALVSGARTPISHTLLSPPVISDTRAAPRAD